MAVPVHEARHEGLALEVDDLGGFALVLHDVGLAADRQDPVAGDRHRLGRRRRRMHRDDRAAADDPLGRSGGGDADGSSDRDEHRDADGRQAGEHGRLPGIQADERSPAAKV
jgi:hypothetical protein